MNQVKLAGTAKRIRGGDGAKMAWAFANIEVDAKAGKKATHSVKAFGANATAIRAFEEGEPIEIQGHLERQKVKDSEQWETVVIVDRVVSTHQQEEDIPF